MRPFWIFVANFFFSIHFAATLYINSSFLGYFFSPHIVGILYVLGALGNIFFFLNAERMLSWLGSRGFMIFFTVATLLSTIGAALATTKTLAIISFLVYASVSMMIYYAFDILLEEVSDNKSTGEVRGLYLTITNVAILGGPILVAITEGSRNFSDLYILAAFFILPLFLLIMFAFKSKRPVTRYLSVALPFRTWAQLDNLRQVTLARTVLELFFAIMVIYTPIHLHEALGFAWKDIGIAFSIMLLPFIFFEWPAGELADRKYGEKEIMAFGFLIMGLAVLVMPFLKTLVVWTIVLFVSRIGASLIEITTDTYFFKQIQPHHVGLISIFRLARPTGLILGAAIGAFSIAIMPEGGMFYVLAMIIFLGLGEATRLIDTR